MDAKEARESLGFNEQNIFHAAKRLGMVWTPWMGDWFTSYSPRNGNSHAEGTWEHWVTLAQAILNHPFTELVRPDVFAAVPEPPERYSETERYLTDEELMAALRPDRYPKVKSDD
jgi:hypothetical protein